MKLFFACAMLALCVVIHAAGLIGLARWMLKEENPQQRFWLDLWMLVRISWGIVALHVVEIAAWACFFVAVDCMPDLGTAYYFSAVTYTSVGYGDILLPIGWRHLAGTEALTGILMAGLSTGFFFVVLNRVFNTRHGPK